MAYPFPHSYSTPCQKPDVGDEITDWDILGTWDGVWDSPTFGIPGM